MALGPNESIEALFGSLFVNGSCETGRLID